MDGEMKLFAVVAMVIFGGLFGSLFLSEYAKHVEKMECLKARGDYIGGACVFRDQKPQ